LEIIAFSKRSPPRESADATLTGIDGGDIYPQFVPESQRRAVNFLMELPTMG
jgi:hypothetical protein